MDGFSVMWLKDVLMVGTLLLLSFRHLKLRADVDELISEQRYGIVAWDDLGEWSEEESAPVEDPVAV